MFKILKKERKFEMKKKILIVVITICLIGGGLYYFMGMSNAKQQASEPIKVQTQKLIPSEITTKVSADGNIKTKNERNIKYKLNGIIDEVYVKEGDQVKKGDLLVKLEDENLQKALKTAKLNLLEAENSYDKLKNKYKSQSELNELQLEEANKNLEIAILSRNKEKQNLENQKYELQEKIKETARNLKTIESNLKDNRHLYNNGAIPKNELNRTQEKYEKTLQEYKNLKHNYQILVEKTIPNALKLADLNVENAKNKLKLLKANHKNDQITDSDLKTAEIKVMKAKQERDNIKSDLDKIAVKAPIAGTVVNIETKEGDKVTEGSTAAKVADIANLVAEIMVDEIDINEINIGQKVNVTSDSFEEQIEGEITFIAPVSTKVGNINKYRTKVEFEDNQGVIKPGMFVNAEITTNHKDNVLTVPSIAVMGEDKKFVFVNNNGQAVKKEVEIGLKNLSQVEIQGIKEGTDVIIGPFTTLKSLKPDTPVTSINQTQTNTKTD